MEENLETKWIYRDMGNATFSDRITAPQRGDSD